MEAFSVMDKMAVSLLTVFLLAVVTRTDASPVKNVTANLTTEAASSSTSSPPSHPVINTTCPVRRCLAGPEHKQLAAFKVSTVLLCALLILAFGLRAYKAIMKRMSDRRKDRWIGPMQSQSVSFHRAQAAVHPSDNAQQRQSCLDETYTHKYT